MRKKSFHHTAAHRIFLTLTAFAVVYVGLSVGLRFVSPSSLRGALPANPTAQDVLNEVIQRGFSLKPSVNELVAPLQFEQVFQSMTTGEILRALVRNDMIPGYNTTTQLLAALPSRGIDLNVLRLKSDGLLTALATAKGGALLGSGPLAGTEKTRLAVEAKHELERWFNTNKVQFLENITPRNLLKLLDDGRIATAPTDSRENMYVYAWSAPNGATTNNIVHGYQLYIGYDGTNPPRYRDPVVARDAVNAIVASLPAGAPHILMNTNYNKRLNEVWDTGLGRYRCLTNPCQEYSWFDQATITVSGVPRSISLPWMDGWRGAVRARMDDFMRRYRDAGGLLDVFIYDAEEYHLSVELRPSEQYLFSQPDVPPAAIWARIRADARWPALAAELQRAGLTSEDLSSTATPWTWNGLRDYRAAIWGRVMQEHRTRYHTQAVYEPVRTYFPNVLFANYRDAYQTHTMPANNYLRMNNSWAGIGSIVGNQQGPSPYSDGDANTPTGLPASLYQQKGFIAVESLEVNANKLILRFGEDVRLPRSGGSTILSSGYRNDINGVFFDPAPYVGASGSRMYTVTSHPDLRTYVVNFTGPNTARTSQPGYPLLWLKVPNPYGEFVSWLRKVRSPLLASSVPVRTYLPSPEYMSTELVPVPPYFAELVFHFTLLGAQIEFWNTTGAGITPIGNKLMGDAFKEVTDLIGFRNRKTLISTGPEWTDDYVLSGMDAGGRKIWRLTPHGRYDAPPVILNNANPVHIRFQSTGSGLSGTLEYEFIMHNAELLSGPSVSSKGFWIQQTQSESSLTLPWPQVATAIGL